MEFKNLLSELKRSATNVSEKFVDEAKKTVNSSEVLIQKGISKVDHKLKQVPDTKPRGINTYRKSFSHRTERFIKGRPQIDKE